MSGSESESPRCHCPHCGGGIEFPAEAAGMGVECPHCGVSMNLVDESAAAGLGSGLGDEEREGLPRMPGRPTAAELAAAFRGRVDRGRPTAAYLGALGMGAVVMVAIPVLYAALLVQLGVWLFRFAGGWLEWARSASGGAWTAGLRTGLFLAGTGLGLFILGLLLRPFFVKAPRPVQALALNPVSEPLLFAFVHMVCDAVGVPRPARIDVDCRMNASVGFRGRTLWPGSDGWILRLGLPMVAGLGLSGFAGVLAHELGHFGQGWAMRASVGIRAMNAWLERAAGWTSSDGAPEPWDGGGSTPVHRGILGVVRIGVGLSQGILRGLMSVGRLVNRQLLRQMEWNADRAQIQLVGSAMFEATFRRLCVLAEVRREVYRRVWEDARAGRDLPEDLPREMARAADRVSEEQAERWCERRLAREVEFWEAHPPDAARIERARELDLPGLFDHGSDASTLFSNFDALAKQVTALHYAEDLNLPTAAAALAKAPRGSGNPLGALRSD